MVARQTHVLIHVERHDIAKGYLASVVRLDECFVNTDWTATGGQSEDKRSFCGWRKGVDSFYGGQPGTMLMILELRR